MTLLIESKPIDHKTVVSLKTEMYKKGKGFVVAKVLTTLKRQSLGFDILNECIAEEIEDLSKIDGLYNLPDGVYELEYNNPSKDWEAGYWDHDGYKLVPVQPNDLDINKE